MFTDKIRKTSALRSSLEPEPSPTTTASIAQTQTHFMRAIHKNKSHTKLDLRT